MVYKVFIDIKNRKDRDVIEIQKTLEKIYKGCQIDFGKLPIVKLEILKMNKYNLIISDSPPTLGYQELESIFINIDPYAGSLKGNIIKVKSSSSVLEWIIKQRLTNSAGLEDKEIIQLKNSYVEFQENFLQSEIICAQNAERLALFAFNQNRTIGVWSPQDGKGTTTFITNFAMFLAEKEYKVDVLEGISKYPSLKSYLDRFTATPINWISWPEILFKPEVKDAEFKKTKWIYNNVKFYPFGTNDQNLNWNDHKLLYYFNYLKTTRFSFLFVDIPGGR